MIGLEDRQFLSQDFGIAHAAGARLRLACEIAGIDVPHPAALAGARRPCSGPHPREIAGRRRCARCPAMP